MNNILLTTFMVACCLLTACKKTSTPDPLYPSSADNKIPESLTGNWVCSSWMTDPEETWTLNDQELFSPGGSFISSGLTEFSIKDNQVVLAIIGEGELQMLEGNYWLKLENSIALPTAGNMNGSVAAALEGSVDTNYPIYEVGSYVYEDGFLTFSTHPEGVIKQCLDWEDWDKLENGCKSDSEAACFQPLDTVSFEQQKQVYREKQATFK